VEAGYTAGRCRSSGLAHQARFGKRSSIKASGQSSRYTSAGKNGSGRGLLSVWMDRQCSNKLECHVAKARRVLMAHGLAGASRKELKDKQLLSLRTELRSNRLNRSGMNKIDRKQVRYSMAHQEERRTWSNLQSLQRFCQQSPGGVQPILLRLQYLNRLRMRVIFPATCYQRVV
jgi:hypothetical protein